MSGTIFRGRAIRLAAAVLAIAILISPCRGENWPQFRGANGSGVSEERCAPSEWSANQISWKIDLPGVGHSAPVIWGNKLFLTSADDTGTTRLVLCLDARTGKTIWTKSQHFNRNPKHVKNSWASSTPAVDGERVFVVFADVEQQVLTAYDLDGTLVWRKDVGPFESQHGQGASPIIFNDLVILTNDQDGPSSIIAFDKRTGRIAWSTPRKSGKNATSYATPFIFQPPAGSPQLICSSSFSGCSALDPRTGGLIWTTG
jgi:outer membrane protein assembly factor BamB